jgi:hypothetical protein
MTLPFKIIQELQKLEICLSKNSKPNQISVLDLEPLDSFSFNGVCTMADYRIELELLLDEFINDLNALKRQKDSCLRTVQLNRLEENLNLLRLHFNVNNKTVWLSRSLIVSGGRSNPNQSDINEIKKKQSSSSISKSHIHK